jgi:hypothetical protein
MQFETNLEKCTYIYVTHEMMPVNDIELGEVT